MAFLHLVNCVILTFAPIFLIFNVTSLHEHGSKICISGVIGYIISAAIKLLVYATFVPAYETWTLYAEVLKELVGVIDVYILVWIFTWKLSKVGDPRSRILGIGLGWALGEMILSHLLIFLFNAGGGEFTWEYLQRAIHANCEIAQLISFACLVWAYQNSSAALKVPSFVLLGAKIVGFPIIQGLLLQQGLLAEWSSLAFEGVYSGVLALATKVLIDIALVI
mmetsp:Transcript_460/g.487  ORF Transcript_460/g.487 Transcript_460/m.487 type:complete len:222 (+) Transcript_460:18-683(+)